MSEALLYQQEGHVVTLTLNKHETRNAISEDEMVDAIVAACSRINADNSVRVAIITGAGSAFSSGGNGKTCETKRACLAVLALKFETVIEMEFREYL